MGAFVAMSETCYAHDETGFIIEGDRDVEEPVDRDSLADCVFGLFGVWNGKRVRGDGDD